MTSTLKSSGLVTLRTAHLVLFCKKFPPVYILLHIFGIKLDIKTYMLIQYGIVYYDLVAVHHTK